MNTATPEMTAREFAKAIEKLRKSIGPGARTTAYIAPAAELPLHCAVEVNWKSNRSSDFDVGAETFGELLEVVAAKWAEYETRHRAATIRKMALAIIRITSEFGECTDAALRNCGEFDAGQVNALGQEACSVADDMADKGPFSIVTLGGANAEAA